jgi:tRNA G26 N,N-dimethylase Trm1
MLCLAGRQVESGQTGVGYCRRVSKSKSFSSQRTEQARSCEGCTSLALLVPKWYGDFYDQHGLSAVGCIWEAAFIGRGVQMVPCLVVLTL